MSAYCMNTFASNALQGLSPFEMVLTRKLRQLTSFKMPKLNTIEPEYRVLQITNGESKDV